MIHYYYIKTCNTCMRILKELQLPIDAELVDIKEKELTVKQLDLLKDKAGSYEALFSRRAKLYKEMGLKDMMLSENEYKHYLLEHYTFLKRPVLVIDDAIFVGNSKKTVDAAKLALNA